MLMVYSDILHACFRAACIRVSFVRSFLEFHSGLAALRYLFIAVNIILVILKLMTVREKTKRHNGV